MKRKIFNRILPFILVALSACSTSPRDKIVGTWTLQDVEADLSSFPEDQQKNAEAMVDQMKGNLQMEFNEDSSFAMIQKFEDREEPVRQEGTWSIAPDGSYFTSTMNRTGLTDTVPLEELTNSKMVALRHTGKVNTKLVFEK